MKLEGALKSKLLLSNFFFFLFLLFCIIALLNPKWGTEYVPREFRRGLDAVFAIDVSRSMDIRDSGPSQSQTRLERGLSIARAAVAQVPGARYAAAIGRSRGYLAVPLTYDSFSTLVFLESLDTSSMTGRSTNLEALVDAAASSFHDASPARKVIVLISDGESHSGIFRNAVNRCAREGIILTTIAVGSDDGRQILEREGDPAAQTVISRRDAAVLRAAAERTGGVYIDSARDDAGSVLSSHLLSLSQEMDYNLKSHDFASHDLSSYKQPKQRRYLFIILALLSYAASKFVTRNFSAKVSALTATAAVCMLFTSCVEGNTLPAKLLLMEANYLNSRGRHDEALLSYLKILDREESAPYAEYGIGLTFYLMDQGEAALQRYEESKKLLNRLPENEHRELRFRNHYNSGIVLFEEGNYDLAADSFREALRADPRKIDAKRNLELSLLSVARDSRSSSENRTVEQEEQREIIFEMLREEEEQLWKSREWAPEEKFTGADL